jgi:hypothetical protein
MTLHADLLAQSRFLARREPKRPKQASLRRAISAAYYALFHLLTFEASRLFVKDQRLLERINRVYGHGEMNDISKAFGRGDLPKAFDSIKGSFPIPQELKDVANAFVNLQQARHDADYDLSAGFRRSEALAFVAAAERAFEAWATIRKNDLARLYLGCFLLWKQWDKTR